ncbi:MAG: PH domain-containing protein [Mariniblastus sp.]
MTVSSERTRLRRGILSKSITEVWHQDVRNVQLKQTLFQRLFGVGMIGISSAGQSGVEISVSGIPDPEVIKSLIDTHRMRRA